MNKTQNNFLALMQTVLDEIKTSTDNSKTFRLSRSMNNLVEAYNNYLEYKEL